MTSASAKEMADKVMKRRDETEEALRVLLDEMEGRRDSVFVERAFMGSAPSYITTFTLEQVANNVNLANVMPLLKKHVDPETDQLIIDQESVEIAMQREVDWSRQGTLGQYLVTHPGHKFPPLLLVMSAPWVDDPSSSEWDKDGTASRDSVDFTPLTSTESVGLLSIEASYALYALDGQHRKIGIEGAIELVRKGRLQLKRADGGAKKNDSLLLDDLIDEHELDAGALQRLPNERVGVEIIPAVKKGETREDASQRVRSVFTHVNKQATQLTGGQIAQLDEGDGFAIVARTTAVRHPLLTKKGRVNFKNSTIATRSASFTTLQTLKEMAVGYLSGKDAFAHWKPKGSAVPHRPSDEELTEGKELFESLITFIADLPSVQLIDQGKDTGALRRFASEKPPGKGHMLFRPVGQVALARACALIEVNGVSLESAFAKFEELDSRGGFELESEANLWWGVLYDGKRMRIRGRDLATQLLSYLVTGLSNDTARQNLTDQLREARRVGANSWMGFDGKSTSDSSTIKLPAML